MGRDGMYISLVRRTRQFFLVVVNKHGRGWDGVRRVKSNCMFHSKFTPGLWRDLFCIELVIDSLILIGYLCLIFLFVS